jgi:hypothetical protein
MFKKSKGLLVSLIVVAAILPVLIIGALSEDLKLRTFADQEPVLRIWTEPDSVVTKPGKSFFVSVYGEIENVNLVIPMVEFNFKSDNNLKTIPNAISYDKSFTGRVKLGEVNVTVSNTGEFNLDIPETGVNTKLPDLRIITSGLKVLSR